MYISYCLDTIILEYYKKAHNNTTTQPIKYTLLSVLIGGEIGCDATGTSCPDHDLQGHDSTCITLLGRHDTPVCHWDLACSCKLQFNPMLMVKKWKIAVKNTTDSVSVRARKTDSNLQTCLCCVISRLGRCLGELGGRGTGRLEAEGCMEDPSGSFCNRASVPVIS